MCRRNFLVFVNFPKQVPTEMSLSREKFVANFRILSLWTENNAGWALSLLIKKKNDYISCVKLYLIL